MVHSTSRQQNIVHNSSWLIKIFYASLKMLLTTTQIMYNCHSDICQKVWGYSVLSRIFCWGWGRAVRSIRVGGPEIFYRGAMEDPGLTLS